MPVDVPRAAPVLLLLNLVAEAAVATVTVELLTGRGLRLPRRLLFAVIASAARHG